MANKPKLESIAPVFAITDVQRARDFYTETLGFSIAFEWADEEGGPIRYVILRQNDCDLHLSQSETAHRAIAYFFMHGVEDYYETVKAAGATISQDLKDWPWNMREFEVTDPDGNRLIFGQDISQQI